jgi:hypothetical protein
VTDHDDGKWDCPPHSKAKHEMLAKYLDAWYPIIASWNGRLVFLDGFAGGGRYTDGSEGSHFHHRVRARQPRRARTRRPPYRRDPEPQPATGPVPHRAPLGRPALNRIEGENHP